MNMRKTRILWNFFLDKAIEWCYNVCELGMTNFFDRELASSNPAAAWNGGSE